MPFDTGVAIALPVYRLESQKMKIARLAIDSLGLAIRSFQSEAQLADKIIASLNAENKAIKTQLKEKDSVNLVLFNHAKDQGKIALDLAKHQPTPWLKDPKTWGLGGVVFICVLQTIFKK